MSKTTNQTRAALVRFSLSAVLLCVAAGLFWYSQSRTGYDVTVVPPTCTDSGYSLYTSRKDGSTRVEDPVEATGHDFGEWITDTQPNGVQPGSRTRQCGLCGEIREGTVDPVLSIPALYLTGSLEGIGKTAEVPIRARFTGEALSFETFATLKYQGHSTLAYAKKNYTLKLFENQGNTEKFKVALPGWEEESKYILKANYTDSSQCRNLICARVWGSVVSSRTEVPEELSGLVNWGAVDGFPVALYINGIFQGLHTMNLHKDEDLFGMDDGLEQAILIANSQDSQSLFRSTAEFTEDSSWEMEFCGTGDSQWIRDKLNALIAFVNEADDQTFQQELTDHLDVDSAIDYLLFMYAMGLADHGAKDLILVAYGADQPLIASVYDMEDAFSLTPEDFLPTLNAAGWDSATGSLLWDRILDQFQPEIQERYAFLRQQILTPEYLTGLVDGFTGEIGSLLYDADAALYRYSEPASQSISQIKDYLNQRFDYLDPIFLKSNG